MSEINTNKELKQICTDYKNIFNVVEDAKQKHNSELEQCILDIKALIEETKAIDEKRAKILDQRYSLEKKFVKSKAESSTDSNEELIKEIMK